MGAGGKPTAQRVSSERGGWNRYVLVGRVRQKERAARLQRSHRCSGGVLPVRAVRFVGVLRGPRLHGIAPHRCRYTGTAGLELGTGSELSEDHHEVVR